MNFWLWLTRMIRDEFQVQKSILRGNPRLVSNNNEGFNKHSRFRGIHTFQSVLNISNVILAQAPLIHPTFLIPVSLSIKSASLAMRLSIWRLSRSVSSFERGIYVERTWRCWDVELKAAYDKEVIVWLLASLGKRIKYKVLDWRFERRMCNSVKATQRLYTNYYGSACFRRPNLVTILDYRLIWLSTNSLRQYPLIIKVEESISSPSRLRWVPPLLDHFFVSYFFLALIFSQSTLINFYLRGIEVCFPATAHLVYRLISAPVQINRAIWKRCTK